jgi:hypothetical protein
MSTDDVIDIAATALLVAGNIVTGGALSAGLLIGGFALSYYGAKRRGEHEVTAAGHRATIASTEAPMPVIYGRARVGARLVDIRTLGADATLDPPRKTNEVLAVAAAWCIGSEDGSGIEGIKEVWVGNERIIIGDDPISDLEDPRRINKKINEFITYKGYLGTHSQTRDTELGEFFPVEWDTDSRLRGIAYSTFFFKYDDEVWGGIGLPRDYTAVIDGQKVFDPRNEQTAFSRNPALCLLDYLTSKKYGAGVPVEEIDLPSVIAAANYLDESAPGGGPRGRIGGIVSTGDSIENNIDLIRMSGRIDIVYENGKFRFHINKIQTPTGFSFTEDNIIGDFRFNRLGSRAVPTACSVTFSDATNDWQTGEVVFPDPGVNNPFVDADGGFENTVHINAPLVDSRTVAYNIAQVFFSEGREDQTVSFLSNEEALSVSIGDVVTVSHETPGWTEKEFWIVGLGVSPHGPVSVTLKEYDLTAYDLDPSTTVPSNPGSDLPNPLFIDPPSEFTLQSDADTALPTQDGQFLPRIKCTWIDPEDAFLVGFELQFRESDPELDEDEGWDPLPFVDPLLQIHKITPVSDLVEYDVRIRSVNSIGTRSDWVEESIIASTRPGGAFGMPLDRVALEYYDIEGEPWVRAILTIKDEFGLLLEKDVPDNRYPITFFKQSGNPDEGGPVKGLPPVESYTPKDPEPSGDYEGKWVWELRLDEKHLGIIAYAMYWGDEEDPNVTQRILWLDVGDEANIAFIEVAYSENGDVATVQVKGDADTRSLHAEERISSIWTSVDTPTSRFTVAGESYQGVYNSGTSYTQNQSVTYEGNTWIWNSASPSGGGLAPPGGSWVFATRFSTTRRGDFTVDTKATRREFRVWGRNQAGLDGPKDEFFINSNINVPPPGTQPFKIERASAGPPTTGDPDDFTIRLQFQASSDVNSIAVSNFGEDGQVNPPFDAFTLSGINHNRSTWTSTAGGTAFYIDLKYSNGNVIQFPPDFPKDMRISATAYPNINSGGGAISDDFITLPLSQFGDGGLVVSGTGGTKSVSSLTFSTGLLFNTSTSTVTVDPNTTGGVPTSRTISTNDGLTGGGDLSANRTFGLTGQALALHSLAFNGIIARTGIGTVAARTITAGSGITVTNGNGIAGNPTISLNTSGLVDTTTNQSIAGVKTFTGGVVIGNLSTAKASGRLYGGTTNPNNAARVNYDGHFYATQLHSSASFTFSDRALKKDIEDWNPDSLLDQLEPAQWTWRASEVHDVGFIAQDSPAAFKDDDGLSISYNRIVTALVAEVKALKKRVKELEEK